MITLKSIIENAKLTPPKVDEVNDTYFTLFTDALRYARNSTEKRGFEINEIDWQTQLSLDGNYSISKPSIGKTNSFTIELLKNTNPQKEGLNISIYGMESGKFELTHYIN